MDHLSPNNFGKKKQTRSGLEMSVCVQNYRVYLSKSVWTFGLLCVKMSKIRCFHQITWF